MRVKILLGLLLMVVIPIWAGDTVTPLNIKLGLWDMTTTGTRSGELTISPEVLASLPPDKRAKFEENMKAAMAKAPMSSNQKTCITKEKLGKGAAFGDEKSNCKQTIITSTTSKLQVREQCVYGADKSDGTFTFEALSPEQVKGLVEMTVGSGDHPMKVISNITAKWIGPACGDVK